MNLLSFFHPFCTKKLFYLKNKTQKGKKGNIITLPKLNTIDIKRFIVTETISVNNDIEK